MPLLSEDIAKQLQQVFEVLESPVKIVYFFRGNDTESTDGCESCDDTRQLIEEVAELSDKIVVEVHDFDKDRDFAQQYKIDKVPALAIIGMPDNKDWGIRFYGIPAGYEFSSLIQDIVLASARKPDLSPKTIHRLEKLSKPVHIQVYVTPT